MYTDYGTGHQTPKAYLSSKVIRQINQVSTKVDIKAY